MFPAYSVQARNSSF